jgi:hypothetical protein
MTISLVAVKVSFIGYLVIKMRTYLTIIWIVPPLP